MADRNLDFLKVKHANCSLCDSNYYEILAKKVQFNFPYKTVICKNCGFIYLNPVPIEEELNQFYVLEYEKYYGIPARFGDSVFKRRGYEIFEFLKGHLPKIDYILEIGSGGGGNLVGLSEKLNAHHLAAFEPGGASNDSLKLTGVKILGDFYDNEPVNLREYQLIILSHVLEHFHDPKSVLTKLWNETSDNVFVYIAIPSLSAINKETYSFHSKLEDYWFRVVHLSYFHESNIEDMLLLSGWKVQKLHKKGNGELLLIVVKAEKLCQDRVIRNVYKEHLEEVTFYKTMTDANK